MIIRRTFFLIAFLILLNIPFTKVYSAEDLSIPGVNCGMANAPDGADKCCQNNASDIPEFRGRDDVEEQIQELDRLQKTTPQSVCLFGEPSSASTDSNCRCVLSSGATENVAPEEICEKFNFKSTNEKLTCSNCLKGGGFWSGLGCIPLSVQSFITDFILKFGLGLAGLVSLLCIIYSAFLLQVSRGNPDRVKKAREYLTNCIIGLVLVIFSIFILQMIGVNILRIPGFS